MLLSQLWLSRVVDLSLPLQFLHQADTDTQRSQLLLHQWFNVRHAASMPHSFVSLRVTSLKPQRAAAAQVIYCGFYRIILFYHVLLFSYTMPVEH